MIINVHTGEVEDGGATKSPVEEPLPVEYPLPDVALQIVTVEEPKKRPNSKINRKPN